VNFLIFEFLLGIGRRSSAIELAYVDQTNETLRALGTSVVGSGELPVSLSGPIANPTTRHLDFCSLVLSQLDSKLQ
jgi:hypothetical protein